MYLVLYLVCPASVALLDRRAPLHHHKAHFPPIQFQHSKGLLPLRAIPWFYRHQPPLTSHSTLLRNSSLPTFLLVIQGSAYTSLNSMYCIRFLWCGFLNTGGALCRLGDHFAEYLHSTYKGYSELPFLQLCIPTHTLTYLPLVSYIVPTKPNSSF